MIEGIEISHHIQKHIMEVLITSEVARFRDMRPPKVDSNLYSYHLKILTRFGFVEKVAGGYRVGPKGLAYADRVSFGDMSTRVQPKIVTTMLIQDEYGNILMYKKFRQPFMGKWTLPFGKVHVSDQSISESVRRDAIEKFGDAGAKLDLTHAGDCYIRVYSRKSIVSSSLAHVFRTEIDGSILELEDHWRWVKPHKLSDYVLAPAVEKIVARTFFNDPYFFEEFEEEIGIIEAEQEKNENIRL